MTADTDAGIARRMPPRKGRRRRARCRRPPFGAPLPHSRTRALPHFPAYGYRWYNPWHGRWLSRDPIGEEGGIGQYVLSDNEPIGRIDLLGLRVMIFELGPGLNYRADFDRYMKALAEVKDHVAAMSDSEFAKANVQWNDVEFEGTRQEFLGLVEFERGSKYTHTVLKDSNQKRNLAQLSSDLDGFFSAAGNGQTFGNITSRTTNLIIGHGDKAKQATIAGYYFGMVGPSVFSQHEEKFWVYVPFEEMKRHQETITRRTGSTTVFVSCHSNTRGLMEKFHWGSNSRGSFVVNQSYIHVMPLGGGQTLAGWSETWEVSVWRCKDDPLAATESTGVLDEKRGVVEVGNLTAEKTLKLEELTP